MKPTTTSPAELLSGYTNAIHMIERLHRRLLDVVTDALDRAKIADINAVQAIMLYNFADQELSVSELRARDYCTGSNSSYNVTRLVEGGFLHRVVFRASNCGRVVKLSNNSCLFAVQCEALGYDCGFETPPTLIFRRQVQTLKCRSSKIANNVLKRLSSYAIADQMGF